MPESKEYAIQGQSLFQAQDSISGRSKEIQIKNKLVHRNALRKSAFQAQDIPQERYKDIYKTLGSANRSSKGASQEKGDDDIKNSPMVQPYRHKYGIEGYEIPKAPHLDQRKDQDILNWKNQKLVMLKGKITG